MPRSLTYSALILRVRPLGESNREAFFLTSGEGIVRATVFGGPKSKLRAFVSPFHQGTLWVYHDPVKDFWKVTDFDVVSWRPGLREKYERVMAANAVSDTILASHGGGSNWEAALALANASLDALDGADGAGCVRVLVHFLWQWADIIGEKPSLRHCSLCGRGLDAAEGGELTVRQDSKTAWFSPYERAFLCADCAGDDAGSEGLRESGYASRGASAKRGGRNLPLGPGARKWLAVVEDMDPGQLSRWTLDAAALGQARDMATTLMACILGKRLASWEWG
jgi:DNA repair protein RecO (recombination protein O)